MVETMQVPTQSKVSLFGFDCDNVTLQQAIQRVIDLVEGSVTGHYVVTPNLDHAVTLHKRPELASIYDEASLVVADGWPLIWASQWLRRPLPERVATGMVRAYPAKSLPSKRVGAIAERSSSLSQDPGHNLHAARTSRREHGRRSDAEHVPQVLRIHI